LLKVRNFEHFDDSLERGTGLLKVGYGLLSSTVGMNSTS
jgi:hypothetical protein